MDNKLFKDLKAGIQDVLDYKKGKLDLRSELIDIPEPPMTYKAKDIKKIRKKNRYSQGIFSKILNVSVKTVQSWESGQRIPSHAALRLIELVDNGTYCPNIYKKT